MAIRWRVLMLLFLVRTTMAFQFQAVAALSPVYQDAFSIGIADIGLLIGLYMSPGFFIAVPGGALGQRFGDKNLVSAGLAMMAVGGAIMAFSDLWSAQLAGRFLAGIGGVLLNVLMTKMVADWFSGHEISFSLAAFVNSWPVGIALALILLPWVAEAEGLGTALTLVAALTASGFLALVVFYRSPSVSGGATVAAGAGIRGARLGAVVVAGAIWGIYNIALTAVFSFGPTLFVERGMGLVEAGSVTSIILWMLAIFGTVGGFLIDWTGRRYLILALGNLGFAVFVLIGSWSDQVLLNVIAMGFFCGLGVGAMVSLPALVLTPASRAIGMGVFFTVFYFCNAVGPMIAGWVADLTGDLASTFHLAAALLVASVLILPLYHGLARRAQRATALL